MNHRYSIFIQWSEEDQKYVVSFPEFCPYSHTHGETYTEALRHGEEVLELLIEEYQLQGRPLPQPLTVVSDKVIAQ
ncbi:MAG: type II toxin-antitoxin system HicB family antitoxin [Microcoleaceae cyanobacterium]